MKERKFLTSTLFIAAVAMSLGPLPAFADAPSDGAGTENSPYSGTVSDWDLSSTTSSDTIYISGLSGYWVNGNKTFAANIVINGDGLTINNGYSSSTYTFTGDISGAGNWIHSTDQDQKYTLTGSLANYSGNITFTAGTGSYFHFGNGGKAATDTNVTGTGSVTVDGNITFNYSDYASDTSDAITIGNKLIEALAVEFTGSVNYNVSSTVAGYGGGTDTLTISNSGTTTFESAVSGFSTVTVGSNSTVVIGSKGSLDLSGATVNLGSTIQNSGTVTIDSNTNIVVGSFASIVASGESYSSTYTLISGGTISGYNSITSNNISFSDYSNITGVSFSNSGSSIVVTVTGTLADGWHGNGTIESPYFTTGGTAEGNYGSSFSFNVSNFTEAGTTIYLATDDFSFGSIYENVYFSGGFTANCDVVIGAAGIYLTNGAQSDVYTFTGKISGNGNWTVTNENGTTTGIDVQQNFVFMGDLSEWSGDFTITTANSSDYVHYGNNTVAETNENISGTGNISVDFGTVQFNYSDYASDGAEPLANEASDDAKTLTVTNGSIEAHNIVFTGSVNYDVSSDLIGWDGTGKDRNNNDYTVTNSTLTVSTAGTVTVSGNVSGFDTISVTTADSALAITGTLTVAENATLTITKHSHASTSVENLVLGDGSTLIQNASTSGSGNNPSSKSDGLIIGTLTIESPTVESETGPSVTIRNSYWENYVNIGALIGENATLILTSDAASSLANVFELGTTTHEEGYESKSQFTGTISISDTNGSSGRAVSLVISEENIAAGAVIEFGTEESGQSLSLGVNAEKVVIAGLSTSNNGTDVVYSGEVTANSNVGADGENITSSSTDTNTLVINTAADTEYSFHGKILDKLNLEKDGTGTQSITFDSGSTFDGAISVVAGTLNLSGVSDSDTAISAGAISVAKDSTLSLSDLTISLGSAIENSGTIYIDQDSVTFVLDGLSLQYSGDEMYAYYMVVSSNGGTLTYADSEVGLNRGNFTLDGSEISSRWNIYVSDDGFVYVYGDAEADFVWAGTSETHSWTTSQDVTDWTMNGEDAYFISESNVTFGEIADSSPYDTVTISENIVAGKVYVEDDYTFVLSDGVTLEATYIDISAGKTLTLTMDESGGSALVKMDSEDFDEFFTDDATTNRENHGNLYIGEGVTFELSEMDNSSTSGSGNTSTNLTGKGTLSVATANSGEGIGLYLPDFEGTVIFREGLARFGFESAWGYTGVYNANATLVFQDGAGIILRSNVDEFEEQEDGEGITYTDTGTAIPVTAALVFETGSHTINIGSYTVEFAGTVTSATDSTIDIEGAGKITFSGSSNLAGTVIMGSSGQTLKFSGSGTHSVGTLEAHTSASQSLDLSELTGSITIGTVAFGNNATLNVTLGSGYYTFDALDFTGDYNGKINFTNGVTGGTGDVSIGSISMDSSGDSLTFTGVTAEITGTVSATSSSTITVNSGASLTVSSGTATISNLSMSSDSSITFNGGSTTITGGTTYGNVSVTDGATLDLTQASQSSDNSGNGSLTIDGEGSTVKVGTMTWGSGSSFGAAMYNNRIQISNGGVLEVTVAQATDTAGRRAFAVTEGKGTYRYSGDGTSYLTDEGTRNIHLGGTSANDAATLIFDVVNSSSTLDVSMQIAYGLGNNSDVGSGSRTTSTGSLVKTGAGTLILSNANLYSGGTTVEQGTLVVQNGSALGSGSVTVGVNGSSATLELDTHLTVSVSDGSTVTFNEGTRLALGGDLLNDIIGSADTGTAVAVITANDISFGEEFVNNYENDLSTLVNQYVSVSGYILSWTWNTDDNTLYVIASVPEPSMFGTLFGISALALTATRRRRRRQYREAA